MDNDLQGVPAQRSARAHNAQIRPQELLNKVNSHGVE